MTPGDPLHAETTDALTDGADAPVEVDAPQVKADETASVEQNETAQAVIEDEAGPSEDSTDALLDEINVEAFDDDAWLDAYRTEAEDSETSVEAPSGDETAAETQSEVQQDLQDRTNDLSDSTDTPSSDLETPHHEADDSDNKAALTDDSDRQTAIEKTGDDAMSKFGHAIGALAERDLDDEDRGMEYAAEAASPSKGRDSVVAPHIAAAERELEESKSSGPVDIFDRIAQAAEAQFDDSRGSTAKRVSELVDDRRVGTKRWTPSKTMKQRMEKLEAARVAAAQPQEAPAAAVEETVVAASAPTSSTATMVTPNVEKTKKSDPVVEPVAEPAPMQEEQTVVISRRDKQPEIEETVETESAGATDAAADVEEDVDELRVVPGARGRRRDRARKSRLDEDFEKIFDEDEKPSIGSLRRKLRSGTSEAAEASAEDGPVASATVTEEEFGAKSETAAKTGLFSRLFKGKKPKAALVSDEAAPASVDEDTLVEAFEADEAGLTEQFDFDEGETGDIEDWEKSDENTRKQKQIAMPIIGLAVAIALGGVGFFVYRMLMGG